MPINSFLYPGASGPGAPYEVTNSLRFSSGSSDYLNRTPSSASNRKTFTFSFWVKRTNLGTNDTIYNVRPDSSGANRISFHGASDTFRIALEPIGKYIFTTRVFRDVSAWYHIVAAFDTTQGTSADRVKVYINGVQEGSLIKGDGGAATYPDQNTDLDINRDTVINLGRDLETSSDFIDMYLAEFVFIDGSQLDPTSFGEFDSDSPNIWKPIDVSGLTFGTNGFYLDFQNSSGLGNDAAGSNNFTVNNLTAIDQSTDTCTNNFATFNSAQPALSNTSFSEGNLVVATNSSASTQVPFATTIPISTGKFYAEFKMIAKSTTSGSIPYIGVLGAANFVSELNNAYFVGGSNLDGVGYGASGVVYSNGSELDSSEASYDDDDIIGVAADITNKKIYFSKNGTYINSGDPAAGSNGYTIPTTSQGFYIFAASLYGASGSWGANFGSPSFSISSGNSDANGYGNFEYAVPSGYYALNTKNLAEFG